MVMGLVVVWSSILRMLCQICQTIVGKFGVCRHCKGMKPFLLTATREYDQFFGRSPAPAAACKQKRPEP